MMDTGGFDTSFSIMTFLFPIFFLLVFGMIASVIIISITRTVKQNRINNNSPVLTVGAKVVSKRSSVHDHHNVSNDMNHSSYSTTYYVTFEVQSGDRMELNVADREFGMLVEGDFGSLTFQGTRYLSFERIRQ